MRTYCKYITANSEKSQALGIAQNITISILGRTLKISAIVYNHNAFPLLLGRKTLKKLKVITDWDTGNWYMRLDKGNKAQIPINFDIDSGIIKLTNGENEFEMEEASNSDETEDMSDDSDYAQDSENEIFVIQLINELQQISDSNGNLELRILTNYHEICPLTFYIKDIYRTLDQSISRFHLSFDIIFQI